jgi:outer membrane receptor protein involved in Fe transport
MYDEVNFNHGVSYDKFKLFPYMKKITLTILLGLSSFGLLAQVDTLSMEYLQDLSLEELLNIRIVSASKVSQKISEAPSVVSVINRKQIHQYGWVSINDVMYRLPGFSPSQDYDRRTISSRGQFEGWNNNHYLLLIDGVPMNDNLYGSAYTSEITPLVFTKNLEIIRGPGSALYGSNATNGVISMNTMQAEDLNGTAEVRMRIGNQGIRIYDAIMGMKNDWVSVISAFNAFSTTGNEYLSYDDTRDESYNYLTSKRRTMDTRNSFYFFNKLEGRGKLAGLSLQYHEQHWNYETGHGWLFYIPDQGESMNEYRRLISLKYNTSADNKLRGEFISRYQLHGIDWNMRFYSNGAFEDFYPYGVSEYLKTSAQDFFTRAQVSYSLSDESVLLGGIENTLFMYKGDDAHTSNIDLENTFEPNVDNQTLPMGAWLAFIDGNTVMTTGIFAQYLSPKLGGKLQATVGARYDIQSFNYFSIYEAGSPEKSKSFKQFNPRLGLVFLAKEGLTIKGLAGRAFRAPSPTEMFGANTYTLASNIDELEPEIITTFELAVDYSIGKNWNVKINGFHNSFENQIAYSVANANLSTNIYSLTSAGVETDVQFVYSNISGFLNYSYSKRLDETILDETISESKKELTWVPAHVANVGFVYKQDKFYASPVFHYQGAVNRRESDLLPELEAFRSNDVKAWSNLDLKLAFTPSRQVDIGLVMLNLLDGKQYLIKNNAYPFDYRLEQRRIMLDVKFTL